MLFRNTYVVCQCFGHADECFYDPTINGSQCICNNNTEGVMCHSCVAGFYRDPAMLYTEACIGELCVHVCNNASLNLCIADCGCFLPGVSDPICNSSTGACFCKANVDPNVNAYCDTCLDGYWNISSANPDGCQGMYACISFKNKLVISMCFLVQNVHVIWQAALVIRHLAIAPARYILCHLPMQ